MTRWSGPEDLSEAELLRQLATRRQMLLDQDDTDWQELDTLLMHCERAVLNGQEERADLERALEEGQIAWAEGRAVEPEPSEIITTVLDPAIGKGTMTPEQVQIIIDAMARGRRGA